MSPSGVVSVTLPRGLWREGTHLRCAEVRPVTGADEAALAESPDEPIAVRATRLLGRCLVSLEGEPAGGSAMARRLSVGDRDALLLHLRRASIGEEMECLLACPVEECAETLDFTLRVGDLILPRPDPSPEIHETKLESDGKTWTVRFRPPTGADLEAAAEWASAEGPEISAERLAERCVARVIAPDGTENRLPSTLLEAFSEAVAEVEPQADLVLRLSCPECGGRFATRLDVPSFVLGELVPDRDRLHRHVHLLALHYHWSEREILSLTPRKRRLYLRLLADESAAGTAA